MPVRRRSVGHGQHCREDDAAASLCERHPQRAHGQHATVCSPGPQRGTLGSVRLGDTRDAVRADIRTRCGLRSRLTARRTRCMVTAPGMCRASAQISASWATQPKAPLLGTLTLQGHGPVHQGRRQPAAAARDARARARADIWTQVQAVYVPHRRPCCSCARRDCAGHDGRDRSPLRIFTHEHIDRSKACISM
jgi:hypothetical protein